MCVEPSNERPEGVRVSKAGGCRGLVSIKGGGDEDEASSHGHRVHMHMGVEGAGVRPVRTST